MRPQLIASAALACGLAAVSLSAPAATAHPAPTADTPTAGVPAVALLAGAAPTTVTTTVDASPTAATATTADALFLQAVDCASTTRPASAGHARADRPGPCPPAGSIWTAPTTFALVKQPGVGGFDGHSAPAHSWPATHARRMLHELLPRSDLPTGRTPQPEPGPA